MHYACIMHAPRFAACEVQLVQYVVPDAGLARDKLCCGGVHKVRTVLIGWVCVCVCVCVCVSAYVGVIE